MMKLNKLLYRRLLDKGMEPGMIPGYIRSLSNGLYSNPHMNLFQVRNHMTYMGWNDFELDYFTYELTVQCLTDNGLNRLEYKPPHWFDNIFESQLPS